MTSTGGSENKFDSRFLKFRVDTMKFRHVKKIRQPTLRIMLHGQNYSVNKNFNYILLNSFCASIRWVLSLMLDKSSFMRNV